MIIHPYGCASDFAVGGPFEPTAANFPALAHLFKFQEASGSTTISDSIGNLVLSGGTVTQNGTTATLSAAMSVIDSGAFTVPDAGKKIIVLGIVGVDNGPIFTAGKVGTTGADTEQGFRLSTTQTVGNKSKYSDGANTFEAPSAPGGGASVAPRAIAMSIDPGSASGFDLYDYDGANYTVATAGSLATAVLLSAFDTAPPAVNVAASDPSLIAILYPSAVPSEAFMKAALAWMYWANLTDHGADTVNGSPYWKVIYPGFRGLT